MPSNPDKILYILGTPLKETLSIAPEVLKVLTDSDIVIAETRKTFFQIFSKTKIKIEERKLYFLDPPRKENYEILYDALSKGEQACLLSDSGMPILFDPGLEVLEFCKKKNYKIKTVPAATSWSTACAVSGYLPPFYLLGFLPQKENEWNNALKNYKKNFGHLVLLETPYRLEKFIKNLGSFFGAQQEIFLAYEIAGEKEEYFWCTLGNILNSLHKKNLTKGEFVVILKSG